MTIVGVDVDAPDFTASSVIGADPDAFNRWMSGDKPDQSSASDTLSIDGLAHNYSVTDAPIIDSVASGGSAAGFVGSTAASGSTISVFANEQLRYLAGVEEGDAFDLPTVLGTRRFEVLGFFHDYGNVNYALHLPAQTFLELFPNAEPQGWGVWVDDEQMETAELGLTELGVEPGSWVSQRDVLAISMAIFDRTFAITRALNTLTLLVAAVAIFASLLAVYQFRRSEYALWRSLGATWPIFFLVSGFPIILMTGVVMLLALPLGIALSWLLIHKINVISFGWTMPVVIDAEPISFLFLVVAAVVLSAFLLASLGQRAAVNSALKELAGE